LVGVLDATLIVVNALNCLIFRRHTGRGSQLPSPH
jgi:hypothetical protein